MNARETTRNQLRSMRGADYYQWERWTAEGRITCRTSRLFHTLWMWAGAVHSGAEGARINAYFNRFGADSFYRRVNRARRACIVGGLSSPASIG